MGLLANKKDIITRYGNRYSAEEWELKKQLERESTTETTTDDHRQIAEQEFRTSLQAAGIAPDAIAKMAALGPMQILNQIESGTLRFSSVDRENLILSAVNTWGKKLY